LKAWKAALPGFRQARPAAVSCVAPLLRTLFVHLSRWPLGLLHLAGGAVGWITYALSPTYRRRFVVHATVAGVPKHLWQDAVGEAGRAMLELPYLWLRPPGEAIRVPLRWHGTALIEAAHAAGRGIVFLTPHLGSFEVTAQAYAERYGARHPITVLYRPARKAWLRELVDTARARPGLATAPATLAGVRQMIRALRRGEAVGLLPDQVPPQGLGTWAPFFGRPAYTMTLAARLVQQPQQDERRALAKAHFGWLARSILERGVLFYAPVARLKRLIRVEGDVTLAERSERPVMWLVPHFVALDVAGVATQLFQKQQVASIYQAQSDPVMDAAIRRARLRFNQGEVFPRTDSAKPLIRAIKKGWAFFNLPDMDFGLRDADFVPFFGVPAATLLAPSRMARALGMVVQPVVAEMLPGGAGYRVRFLDAWTHFPTDDAPADTAAMNRWIESEIRRNPAQYLWVHKRFKTRPPGEPGLY
jgi:KDO2-lipid IV(A) lauroyltransferase